MSGYIYVSGLARGIVKILGGIAVTASVNSGTTTLSTNSSYRGLSGKPQFFKMATSYTPTVVLTQGPPTYNASALMWTQSVTPQFTSSTLYIRPLMYGYVGESTASAHNGLAFGLFSSNTAGAATLPYGFGGFASPASTGTGTGTNAPIYVGCLGSSPCPYGNSTGAAFNLYVCGYILTGAGSAGASFFGTNSTHPFSCNGTVYCSLLIYEVSN